MPYHAKVIPIHQDLEEPIPRSIPLFTQKDEENHTNGLKLPPGPIYPIPHSNHVIRKRPSIKLIEIALYVNTPCESMITTKGRPAYGNPTNFHTHKSFSYFASLSCFIPIHTFPVGSQSKSLLHPRLHALLYLTALQIFDMRLILVIFIVYEKYKH